MIPSTICVTSILAQILLVKGEYLEDHKECLEMNNLTLDEMKRYKHGGKMSEPQLCVVKCASEELGVLESDGTINLVELEKHPRFIMLSDNDKENTKACLRKLPKIVECVDIEGALDCVPDVLL